MNAEVHTLGCRVNQYESEMLRQRLAALGRPETVHVVNTCSVTALAERKGRQLVRKLRRAYPDTLVVAVGCQATVAPRSLAQAGADLVLPNRSKCQVTEAVEAHLAGRALPSGDRAWPPLDEEQLLTSAGRVRAPLKIQDGCDASCSYCMARRARGPLRSKSPEVTVREAQRLAEAGHREIVLTGVNLGQYAPSIGEQRDLVALLGKLVHEVPEARFRLSSLGPESVTAELIDLLSSTPAICPHLHVPLQSGDDAVLRRMGRAYRAQEYETRMHAFLRQVPGATFGTDVMVGFPGETRKAHRMTLALLDRLRPLNTHVFRFNPRPQTPAASFGTRVSPQEATMRATELACLSTRWSVAARVGLLGTQVQVIAESLQGGMAWGYSENYLYIGFPTGGSPRGTITPVRVAYVDPTRAMGVKQDRYHSN